MAKQCIASKMTEAQCCMKSGELGRAISLCRSVLKTDRNNSDAMHIWGLAEHERGNFEEAVRLLGKAVKLDPQFAPYQNSLGVALRSAGRMTAAASHYRRAIILAPGFVDAYINLANLHIATNNCSEAEMLYRRVLEITPGSTKALNGLGVALNKQERLDEAETCLRQALELQPTYLAALKNLMRVVAKQCRRQERMRLAEQIINCNAEDLEARSDLLMMHSYDLDCTADELFHQHQAFGEVVQRQYPRLVNKPVTAIARPLRIGYVSPDFHNNHPVVSFISGILHHHDQQKFDIFCYSTALQGDATSAQLQQLVTSWVDAGTFTHRQLVERISSDQIDILVDLAGHTLRNSLPIFAMKPAPIQVTWLGYPNTTGLTAIDYRITDAIADPVGEADLLHSEKLWRLAPGFLCYTPPDTVLEVALLPSLKRGYITFGSFNNLDKLSDRTVKLWSALLHHVQRSKLLLKAPQFKHESNKQKMAMRFMLHGISADRLDFRGPEEAQVDHLAKYAEMDIALDPFPYNGTTTTCEALWMGVPVITLAGERHASRVGASIMTSVGLPELVCRSTEAFLACGVRLASDMQKLAKLRLTLRNKLLESPLCDAATFTLNLEEAYQQMWISYCKQV